jgi:hypothetical protein
MRKPGEAPPVRAALESFRKARMDLANAQDGEAARNAGLRLYESMAQACEAYFRQTVPPLNSQRQEHFPPEVAMVLASHLTNLLAGRLDQAVRDLVERSGARGRAYIEQQDVDAAVRFLQAVQAGLIQHAKPVAQIAEWYGVNRATAQKWRREASEDLLAKFWPNASPDVRVSMLTKTAKRGGARYTQFGRGQKAITARARQR